MVTPQTALHHYNTHISKSAVLPVSALMPQTIPPTRPITRAQHRLFTINHTHTTTPPPSETDSSEETDSSSETSHLGVTEGTASRRNRIYARFNRKNRIHQGRTHISTALHWIEKQSWQPSTKLSHFGTLLKMLELKNVNVIGDRTGAIRQLKSASILQQPSRVPPLDLQSLLKAARRTDAHHRALLHMAWAFAARLTSITQLTRSQINLTAHNERFTIIRATFRAGKTILATGAYTITALIPTESANWISTRPAKIFDRDIKNYYSKMKSILKPFKVRSIRRGALQFLASKNTSPETLMLLSRHKSISSLYAYLDDGAEARWEIERTLNMNAELWDIKIHGT